MLHIINKSPFERDSFKSCIKHAADGSSFLLIEDGVYAAMAGTECSEQLSKAQAIGKVVALKSDIETRGLQEKIADGVELVEYADFVNLVVENDRVQSWL